MTIILFLISLFVLCGLVISKIFEIKFEKTHFLADAFMKGDAKIHQLIGRFFIKYNFYKKITHIFLFEFLPSYIYRILVQVKDYISKNYYAIGERFSGKKILRSNGSVSFLLEQLSEDKSNSKSRKV